MPTTGNVVRFKAGLSTAFTTLSKDLDTVYFLTDTQQFYVGETEYSRPVQAGTKLPSGYLPPNSLFVLTTGNRKDLYFSASGTSWSLICSNIPVADDTYGDTTKTVGFGDSIVIPSITVDNGTITNITEATITLPKAPEDAEITITPATASGTVVTSVVKTPETTTGVTVSYATPEGSVTGNATTFVTGVSLNDSLELSGTTQAADATITAGATSIPTTQAVKTYVDNAVGQVTQFAVDSNGGEGYESLAALKEAHETGTPGTFYLVVNPDPESNNAFIEYFWSGTSYELAGQFGSVNTADFVQSSANLTSGNLVVGAGTKNVSTIANGTSGQVLSTGASGLEWVTPVSSLDDLSDVQITSPTQGQGLVYNAADSRWENGPIEADSVDWTSVQGRPTSVTVSGDVEGTISIGTGTTGKGTLTLSEATNTELDGKVNTTTTVAITGGATAAATALSGTAVSLNVTSLSASSLTGAIPSTVTATTQTANDNSTKIATTAYADAAAAAAVTSAQLVWGSF